MEGTSASAPAEGWYPDPYDSALERYWDGFSWTAHTRGTGTPQAAISPPAPSAGPQHVVYVESASNGLAVAALVLGIVGLVLGLIPILFFIAWICGIVGFVLGLVGRRRATKNPAVGRKTMATWGVALSILAFGMGCVGYAVLTDAFEDASDELESTSDCLDQADTLAEINQCS